MEDSNNYSETETLKLRGKTAISSAHKNVSIEDERRITNRISDIYQVTIEEASDIHVNYHHDRIRNMLRNRAKKHGMTDKVFEESVQRLNILKYALSISRGELIEMEQVTYSSSNFQLCKVRMKIPPKIDTLIFTNSWEDTIYG